MATFIDRRDSKQKSAVNRRRFIHRFKKQIKNAVANSVSKRSITDTTNGEQIHIPVKDLSEPTFKQGPGGIREFICPKNKEFVRGDKIKRPPAGVENVVGSEASDHGYGLDEFIFEISRDEFLNLFFDDLALPDLVKKDLSDLENSKKQRAGFTKHGSPSNINIIRTMRNAKARHIAIKNPLKIKIDEYETMIHELENDPTKQHQEKINSLKSEIEKLKKRVAMVPYVEDIDIRYNLKLDKPDFINKAVMFCIMDVSGSMDEIKKDLAKRFFLLLYIFLKNNYEKIDVVFIRHHTTAKAVNEEEFFYSRETGGTVVSSALELMRQIMQANYLPSEWNIYAAQASDGDNWNADSPFCSQILSNDILPYLQYYAYIEIMPRHHQSLWQSYQQLKKGFKNFQMQHINDRKEIYPVFRELFKREMAHD